MVVTGPADRRGGALGGGDRGCTPVGLGLASSAAVGSTPTWPPAEAAGARPPRLLCSCWAGLLGRPRSRSARLPCHPADDRRGTPAPAATTRACGTWPIRQGADGPDRLPRFGRQLVRETQPLQEGSREQERGRLHHRATPTPLEATWPHCSWCSRWSTPYCSATPSSPTPAPAQSPSSTTRLPASPRANCWWSLPGSACWVRCCWGWPGAPRAPGAPSVASCGRHAATWRARSPSSNATTPPSARSGSASADWRSCARRPARHRRPGSGPASRRSTRTRRGAAWLHPASPAARSRGARDRVSRGHTIASAHGSSRNAGRGQDMETSFAGSPSCLAELRRAIRHSLAEVPAAIPDEVVDDLVLAVSEAATNAILYGSDDAQPVTVT